ncbi:hypothetical protein FRB99_000173, partial [Tulasnella sp. 403]
MVDRTWNPSPDSQFPAPPSRPPLHYSHSEPARHQPFRPPPPPPPLPNPIARHTYSDSAVANSPPPAWGIPDPYLPAPEYTNVASPFRHGADLPSFRPPPPPPPLLAAAGSRPQSVIEPIPGLDPMVTPHQYIGSYEQLPDYSAGPSRIFTDEKRPARGDIALHGRALSVHIPKPPLTPGDDLRPKPPPLPPKLFSPHHPDGIPGASSPPSPPPLPPKISLTPSDVEFQAPETVTPSQEDEDEDLANALRMSAESYAVEIERSRDLVDDQDREQQILQESVELYERQLEMAKMGAMDDDVLAQVYAVSLEEIMREQNAIETDIRNSSPVAGPSRLSHSTANQSSLEDPRRHLSRVTGSSSDRLYSPAPDQMPTSSFGDDHSLSSPPWDDTPLPLYEDVTASPSNSISPNHQLSLPPHNTYLSSTDPSIAPVGTDPLEPHPDSSSSFPSPSRKVDHLQNRPRPHSNSYAGSTSGARPIVPRSPSSPFQEIHEGGDRFHNPMHNLDGPGALRSSRSSTHLSQHVRPHGSNTVPPLPHSPVFTAMHSATLPAIPDWQGPAGAEHRRSTSPLPNGLTPEGTINIVSIEPEYMDGVSHGTFSPPVDQP